MKKLLVILSLVLFSAGEIFAHGVGYRESELRAIPKMSYCEASVFSPNDSKFAAQTGRTDEGGRFAFIPDISGDWRVVVSDGQGHRCEAVIKIDDVNKSEAVIESTTNQSKFIPAILGVSIIFNIALFIVNRRQAHAH